MSRVSRTSNKRGKMPLRIEEHMHRCEELERLRRAVIVSGGNATYCSIPPIFGTVLRQRAADADPRGTLDNVNIEYHSQNIT